MEKVSLNLPIKEIVKEDEIAVESDPDFLLSLSFEDIDKILRSLGFYFYKTTKSKPEIKKNIVYSSIYRDGLGNVLLLEYKLDNLNVNIGFGSVSLSGIYLYRNAKLFLNILNGPQEVIQEVDLEKFLEHCPYRNVVDEIPTRIKKLIEGSIKPRPGDLYF